MDTMEWFIRVKTNSSGEFEQRANEVMYGLLNYAYGRTGLVHQLPGGALPCRGHIANSASLADMSRVPHSVASYPVKQGFLMLCLRSLCNGNWNLKFSPKEAGRVEVGSDQLQTSKGKRDKEQVSTRQSKTTIASEST